jgi:hypothetical protein
MESTFDLASARETLAKMQSLESQLPKIQKVIVEWLIYRHGGLCKAAIAVGESPSNFSNLRSGKRKASLKLLAKFLANEEQPNG